MLAQNGRTEIRSNTRVSLYLNSGRSSDLPLSMADPHLSLVYTAVLRSIISKSEVENFASQKEKLSLKDCWAPVRFAKGVSVLPDGLVKPEGGESGNSLATTI